MMERLRDGFINIAKVLEEVRLDKSARDMGLLREAFAGKTYSLVYE